MRIRSLTSRAVVDCGNSVGHRHPADAVQILFFTCHPDMVKRTQKAARLVVAVFGERPA